jgi:hypothetical protein
MKRSVQRTPDRFGPDGAGSIRLDKDGTFRHTFGKSALLGRSTDSPNSVNSQVQEKQMINRRRRTILAVALGSALAVGVAAFTATGAFAGARPHGVQASSNNVLHIDSFTDVQTGPQPVAAGDRYAFFDTDSGSDTGNDLWDCTATDPQGDGICYGQFDLSRGTISATTVGNLAAPTFSAVGEITGGTGAYAGRTGKIVAAGTLKDTPFTLYLQ